MKRRFYFVISAVLLVALAGCVAKANPDSTVLSTAGTQATEATISPTETATDIYQALLDSLPETPFELQCIDEFGISYAVTDPTGDEIREYAEVLYAAGYTEIISKLDYTNFLGIKDYFQVEAMNAYGNAVKLEYYMCNVLDGSQGIVTMGKATITLFPVQQVSPLGATMAENTVEWEENEYRAMVPEPETKYWRGSLSSGENGTHYSIYMQDMDLAQLKSYAQELQQFGFDRNISECIRGGNNYSFAAYNGGGWWVRMFTLNDSKMAWDTVLLCIAKPGIEGYEDWEDASFSRLIEEPPVNWHRKTYGNYNLVYLDGMDYQMALTYIQSIEEGKQTVIEGESISVVGAEQDDASEQLRYRAEISVCLDEELDIWTAYDVILTYDSGATKHPCTLTIASGII